MLKGKLIHPEILQTLAAAGHGSRVLIADGNYPFATKGNPDAKRVFLNLSPGLIGVTDALEALVDAIRIEAAHVMVPDDKREPAIFAEFRKILPADIPLQPLGRFQFYDAANERDLCLVIATGEKRIYANVLLTIGVV